MMKMITGTAFIAFAFHAPSSFAIGDLSLNQALSEGLQNNPQMKSTSAALDGSKVEKKGNAGWLSS